MKINSNHILVPIGKPISNVSIKVANTLQFGDSELVVCGECVALCYLNMQGKQPLAQSRNGSRTFQMHDLVKYLPSLTTLCVYILNSDIINTLLAKNDTTARYLNQHMHRPIKL